MADEPADEQADEPATPPKKADLAALPDDVLRTHIFQFSALQKENEFLRAEVARLRRTMLTPYLNGAVTIIAKASADGFAGVDIHDRAAANAFAETLAADTNNPDMARGIAVYLGAQNSTQLSKADRAWVIERLTKRGFSVTTNLNEDGDVTSLSVAFSYGWSEIEARDRERTDGNPVPPRFRYQSDAVSFSPPPPRFAVGTAVECQLRKGEWCPGEVVQIGWPEAMRDLGPVPEGPYQVKLEAGNLIMAPEDTDEFIRLRPDPFAPAAHELLQAVKDAGVSDDKLLDAALKAADKIADKLERKDLSSWEEAY